MSLFDIDIPDGSAKDMIQSNLSNPQPDTIPTQRIKTHPFFIMRYGKHTLNPKQQSEQQEQKQGGGSSRSVTPIRGFNSHLSDVPE